MSTKKGLDIFKEVLWVPVGQRAAELPAVKVGGLEENSTTRSDPLEPISPDSSSQILMAGNFAAL